MKQTLGGIFLHFFLYLVPIFSESPLDMEYETKNLVEQFALKIGEGVEFTSEIMLRQAAIAGVISILTCLLIPVVLWNLFFLIKENTRPKNDGWANWDSYYFPMIWGAFVIKFIIMAFAFFSSLDTAITAITAIFNPYYWVIKNLL